MCAAFSHTGLNSAAAKTAAVPFAFSQPIAKSHKCTNKIVTKEAIIDAAAFHPSFVLLAQTQNYFLGCFLLKFFLTVCAYLVAFGFTLQEVCLKSSNVTFADNTTVPCLHILTARYRKWLRCTLFLTGSDLEQLWLIWVDVWHQCGPATVDEWMHDFVGYWDIIEMSRATKKENKLIFFFFFQPPNIQFVGRILGHV